MQYLSIIELADLFKLEEKEIKTILEELEEEPIREYKSIELFAGAGGLALGMEMAGFETILLNEKEKAPVKTLRTNRPFWNVIHEDITKVSFKEYKGKIDFLAGGFPCQAFSYAGKQAGFGDTRGTMFFEFARAIEETQPSVFLGENVKGLLTHDNGRTIETIKEKIKEIGYTLIIQPSIVNSVFHRVPQKRERVILVGVRNDLIPKLKDFIFTTPFPYNKKLNVEDAFLKGLLYDKDVPESEGQKYSERKKKVLNLVPAGGCWKQLPLEIQKEYMGKSFFSGGGKTGIARRLSYGEPCLTLTCSPSQNQTERCHPTETRPLTVREYARIQTFPDEWIFEGSLSNQYKQIGNAVPVNLAYEIGKTIIRLLNKIEKTKEI